MFPQFLIFIGLYRFLPIFNFYGSSFFLPYPRDAFTSTIRSVPLSSIPFYPTDTCSQSHTLSKVPYQVVLLIPDNFLLNRVVTHAHCNPKPSGLFLEQGGALELHKESQENSRKRNT